MTPVVPKCRRRHKPHYLDKRSAATVARRLTEEQPGPDGRPWVAFRCCSRGWGVRKRKGFLPGWRKKPVE